MITALAMLILAAFVLHAFATAPCGYQDARGFHLSRAADCREPDKARLVRPRVMAAREFLS